MTACSLLLNRNYADPDEASAVSASSEQAAYPASNLYDIYRRAKVHRTAGYFLIESGSNDIVFREAVGVDITATVAAGAYTSVTAFLAAVKTALDAAGAATYTVTQESDLRLKIASNLGGGATVFQLRWATSTAMAAIMGFAAANLTGAANYTADEIAIHTEEWWKYDMGVPLNPQAVILASQRNSDLKLTPNAVIRIQGNSTDSWTSPAFDEVVTYDSKIIYLGDPDGLHTAPLRYWRIHIVDPKNTYGYLEFSLVFIGTGLDINRGRIQFPLRWQRIDRSETTYAEAGNSFSNVLPKTAALDLEWNAMLPADIELLASFFEEFGTHEPYWVSLDPDGVFSSAPSRQVRFVKTMPGQGEELVSPANFGARMRIQEEI